MNTKIVIFNSIFYIPSILISGIILLKCLFFHLIIFINGGHIGELPVIAIPYLIAFIVLICSCVSLKIMKSSEMVAMFFNFGISIFIVISTICFYFSNFKWDTIVSYHFKLLKFVVLCLMWFLILYCIFTGILCQLLFKDNKKIRRFTNLFLKGLMVIIYVIFAVVLFHFNLDLEDKIVKQEDKIAEQRKEDVKSKFIFQTSKFNDDYQNIESIDYNSLPKGQSYQFIDNPTKINGVPISDQEMRYIFEYVDKLDMVKKRQNAKFSTNKEKEEAKREATQLEQEHEKIINKLHIQDRQNKKTTDKDLKNIKITVDNQPLDQFLEDNRENLVY